MRILSPSMESLSRAFFLLASIRRIGTSIVFLAFQTGMGSREKVDEFCQYE
jgi:hypothetical protein